MRWVLQILISIVWVFLINTIFYFVSDDYENFLRDLKYSSPSEQNTSIVPRGPGIASLDVPLNLDNTADNILVEEIIIPWVSETILGKWYRDIIDRFQIFNLKPLELNTNLFDITNQYPESYFEYYSKDVTLYLFPSKGYPSMLDFFTYLSGEQPYTIKEINNFWSRSFYINLDPVIADRFVRIIIEKKWIVFGIKIHTSQYATVKEILHSLLK